MEFLYERCWDNSECFIVIIFACGIKNLQTIFDRESWGNNKDMLRESRILWCGDFVQDLPGDEHGHHNRLA